MIEHCYTDRAFANRILPSTLEGCVVRISDIIAYLGKDRQDAERANLTAHTVYVEYNNDAEKQEAERSVARLWNMGKVVKSERGE